MESTHSNCCWLLTNSIYVCIYVEDTAILSVSAVSMLLAVVLLSQSFRSVILATAAAASEVLLLAATSLLLHADVPIVDLFVLVVVEVVSSSVFKRLVLLALSASLELSSELGEAARLRNGSSFFGALALALEVLAVISLISTISSGFSLVGKSKILDSKRTMTAVILSQPVPSPMVLGAKHVSKSFEIKLKKRVS